MANRALDKYRAKRDFGKTSEPLAGPAQGAAGPLTFVIQKHWASRLHYDFRLEFGGVLLSWAVPKGPSFDPAEKRAAIHVEDHPVSYGGFEGSIPAKQYGAGTVIVWDNGTWEPLVEPADGMRDGKLLFKLHGQKLAGLWELVRISKPGDKQDHWILFKKRGDAWARPMADYDVVTALPDSVLAQPLGLVEDREPRETSVQQSQERAADLTKAVKAPLPARLEPQLATLASKPPEQPGWVVETKFDGYRILARIERGQVHLFTRNGNDWTDKMPALAAAVSKIGIRSGWLDGEIIVLGEQGLPDFNRLQNAMDASKSSAVEYLVFDLPYLDGKDLRAVPLWSRRKLLEGVLQAAQTDGKVRFSQGFLAPAAQMLQAACELKLEGVMLKRQDAP